MRSTLLCGLGLREDGHADEGCRALVRIEVRDVGKVDSRCVSYGLEAAGGVKVTDCLSGVGGLGDGTLGVADSGAEGAGAGDLVRGEAVDELGRGGVSNCFGIDGIGEFRGSEEFTYLSL
jgi:hypothetical protein